MTRPPNVIVFLTDQQRWDSTGVHGNPLGLTPHFDFYSRSGTLLSHHFTNQPVCGPARAALQTGLYPTQNGSYRNGIPLRPGIKTLADYFNQAGYQTGYIGKWHLSGAGRGAVPKESRGGYRSWLAANCLEFVSDVYDTWLFDEENEPVFLPGYRIDALTDASIRFIHQRREEPFFLFLSFLEPHHQNHRDDYPGPTGHAERYHGRWTPPDLQSLVGSAPQHLGGYWAMVKRLDEAFGRVMDALQSMRLLENTAVLFTSDHGCHFKTRNDEYKRSCHDSSLRVPALFHGPGFEGGRHLQSLTSLIDLPPTLLAAANIPIPTEMPGRNILTELRGQSRQEEEDFIIAQISESEHGRTIRTRRWKYAVSSPWTDAVRPDSYGESHLYDLQADPYELDNLIGKSAFRTTASQLRQRLLSSLEAIGEPEIPVTLAKESASGQRGADLPSGYRNNFESHPHN